MFCLPWSERLNVETGQAEPNTEAVFIFIGLLRTLAAVALAAFSLPHLMRARYDLFYFVHVPSAALFVSLGAVHEFEMQVFVVPGLVTYFLDRTDFMNTTASSRFHRMNARVRVMSAHWLRIELLDSLGVLTSEGATGTQFAYLRVPVLGQEAHAFSLASGDAGFVIKATGDWTTKLHQLATKQASESLPSRGAQLEDAAIPVEQLSSITTELVFEIDGVYGNVTPPWRCFSHVLFIGGGAGVTPWLPAMQEHHELHNLLWADVAFAILMGW